ncbi:protein FAM219B isoform X2 [Nannospalax galili]|uniref:protein FAM219B isoform X2 n=1 Tax=Nannospalax galili TaxID=1026970 RepID=UPI00111C6F9C|nr:protein FAM219B isoform X2 [Nannospalax galili]
MATGEFLGHAVRTSTPGPRPGAAPEGAAGAAGLPSGRSAHPALRPGERSAAVEKRGPYMVTRAPSIQAKLRECGGRHRGSQPGRAAATRGGPPSSVILPPEGRCSEKHRDLAKAVLRRKGMLGALPNRPNSSGKRSVKFNKGYTALSQSPDENLVSLDSDSDGELESRYSSGYSSAEVNQDVSRQLLQDGYHLDEIPDDEDLDLIPPKPMASSTCSCCWCCLGDSSCTLQ